MGNLCDALSDKKKKQPPTCWVVVRDNAERGGANPPKRGSVVCDRCKMRAIGRLTQVWGIWMCAECKLTEYFVDVDYREHAQRYAERQLRVVHST